MHLMYNFKSFCKILINNKIAKESKKQEQQCYNILTVIFRTRIGLSRLEEDHDNGPSHLKHQRDQNQEDLSRVSNSDRAQLGSGQK